MGEDFSRNPALCPAPGIYTSGDVVNDVAFGDLYNISKSELDEKIKELKESVQIEKDDEFALMEFGRTSNHLISLSKLIESVKQLLFQESGINRFDLQTTFGKEIAPHYFDSVNESGYGWAVGNGATRINNMLPSAELEFGFYMPGYMFSTMKERSGNQKDKK